MKNTAITSIALVLGLGLQIQESIAQGGSHSATGKTGTTAIKQGPAMEAVDAGGHRTPIPASSGFTFKTEKAGPGENVLDVTRRNGYLNDAATVNAIKRWNPEVKSLTREVGDGKPVHLVSPIQDLPDRKVAVSPKAAAVSPEVFRYQGVEIQRTRAMVSNASLKDADKARLLGATDQVERANAIFAANAARMSPRQRVLAEAQVELAGKTLRNADSSAFADATRRQSTLGAVDTIAASTESFARAVSLPPRKLTVIVKPTPQGRPAEAMDVYVIPRGFMVAGDQLDLSKIRRILETLSFTTPTSPASGELEAGIPYAVWIGPRNAFDSMARLIQAQGVRNSRSVDATRAQLDDLVFEASDKVVGP
ncbi:hypothetical protein [Variovorax sp. YR216]|uniref:hypothetical protein n=1 Tax=Variovorax sp. YR216 TaxID=1882828 RepID=UPI00089D88B5|nr:hypothetical protein [Variovorax sp. YR216]SEB10089.1 hypothetical protein SAMN05444680_107244 [Variovorax sp. YR216]